MLELHITKKLDAKFSSKSYRQPDETRGHLLTQRHGSPTMPNSWHANLIVLQRRQYIFLMHDETRFPVLLGPMRKPDFDQFARHFQFGLMNTLLKLGADERQMETATNFFQDLRFDTDTMRSVLGSMNIAIQDLEWRIAHDGSRMEDLDVHQIGVWLADRPVGVKNGKEIIWPKKAMLDLLSAV